METDIMNEETDIDVLTEVNVGAIFEVLNPARRGSHDNVDNGIPSDEASSIDPTAE